MTDYLYYLFLGLIQGTAEWLPVSSEGVLTTLGLLSGNNFDLAIRIALWLHIGTLGAVLVVYWRDWKNILFNWKEYVFERNFLIITTIATGVLGLPINFLLKYLDAKLMSVLGYFIIGGALLITAGLLWYANNKSDVETIRLQDLSLKQQFLVGLVQGVTIIPGVSRSGSTVSALLLFKVDSEDAFRGSFLMSVPAVLGAAVLDVLDLYIRSTSSVSIDFLGIFVGIVSAFIIGILTLKILIEFARNVNFTGVALTLAIVLILLGILVATNVIL